MAVPTTPVLTTFTGANESPLSEGGIWSASPMQNGQGSLRRFSNTARAATTGTSPHQSPLVASYGADQEAYGFWGVLPASGEGFAVWCRVTNPNNPTTAQAILGVYTEGTGFRVFEFTSGASFAQIGSTVGTVAGDNEGIWITVIGTAVVLRHYTGGSWVDRVTTTTTISGGGQIGLECNGANIYGTSFGGGTYNPLPEGQLLPGNRMVPSFGRVPGILRFAGAVGGMARGRVPGAQIYPTSPLLDTFDRTDGSVGGNWTQSSSDPLPVIVSNRAASGQADGVYASGWYNPLPDVQDTEVWANIVQVPFIGSGREILLQWRMRNPTNTGDPSASGWSGYMLHIRAADAGAPMAIDAWDGSTPTAVFSDSDPSLIVQNGDQIVVSHIDSGLQVWRERNGDWTCLISLQNFAHMRAGRIGWATSSPDVLLEDFGGGAPGSTAPATTNIYQKLGTVLAGTVAFGDRSLTANRTGTVITDPTPVGADSFQPAETGFPAAGTFAGGGDSVTRTEAGVVTAGTLAIGADVFTASELGLVTAGTLALGSRSVTFNRTNTVTTRALAFGADVFTSSETGTITAGTLAIGADVFTASETGFATSAARLAGLDSFQPAETNTVTAGTISSGVDASTFTRTGTATTRALLLGIDSFNPAELGTVTSAALAYGADVFTAVEMGTVTSTALVYGSSFLVSGAGTTYTKDGTVAAVTVAFGADVFTASETGFVIATSRVIGLDSFTAVEAGIITAATRLSGVDAFTAAETGFVTTKPLALGARSLTANRTGTVTTAARAFGADSFNAAEAGIVWAGALAAGADSFQPTENGTAVAGTFASGVSQSSTPLKIKTGTVVAGTLAYGADATTFTRAGRVIAGTIFVGSKLTEKTKAGTVTAATRVSGLDSLTAQETGTATAGTRVSGGDAVIFNRSGFVVARPISSADYVWITSARPVTGPYDTPTPDNQIGSAPTMTVLQSSPTSQVTSDPQTGAFTSDPELAP